jgi:membrane associated rhomboid family serine protease
MCPADTLLIMIIIPYSAELGLARKPYVTYAVIILCLLIYYMQTSNRAEIQQAVFPYCNSIYDESLDQDDVDLLRTDRSICIGFLYNLHSQPDKDVAEDWLHKINERRQIYSDEDMDRVVGLAKEHYDDFSQQAPASLDAKLMYDPSTWNPIRAITSALAHASWLHVIGNLIFFFAFAAAIEILLDKKLHYIGFMLLIAFVTSITYSISIMIGSSPPLPSLGLSGVVSGIIGLAGYLMPRARIRTFIWLIVFYARSFPMPAWILALWFIGWDAYSLMAYSDTGGINLVAHVSGGIAGFLYGYLFLKNRKEEIQDELNDEIEYMKGTRKSQFGTTGTYAGGDKYQQHIRERDAIRENAEYSQKLYKLVNTGNDSEVIALFLKDYDLHRESVEIYEDLFNEMEKWRRCRALLCLGRLTISLLLEQKQKKRALDISRRCLEMQDVFVLASPAEAITLTQYAMELQQYPLAYYIIRHAEKRYGEYIDLNQALLLEAKLLLLHLDKREISKDILKKLIARKPIHYRNDIASLVEIYKHG